MPFPDFTQHDREHLINPQIGDYWQEMYCPVAVVVDATDFCVVVCETTRSTSEHTWTWDLSELKIYTRKEFRYRWTYGRIGNENFSGNSEKEIDNQCWCHVLPRAHEWVHNAAKAMVETG